MKELAKLIHLLDKSSAGPTDRKGKSARRAGPGRWCLYNRIRRNERGSSWGGGDGCPCPTARKLSFAEHPARTMQSDIIAWRHNKSNICYYFDIIYWHYFNQQKTIRVILCRPTSEYLSYWIVMLTFQFGSQTTWC